MLKIVNIKTEPYDIYIGRGSILGNPFVIGKDGNREEVISKFEEYARKNEKILHFIKTLKDEGGGVLGCHCKPKACHGDILIKLYDELST